MPDNWDFAFGGPDFMPERAAGYNNVKIFFDLLTEYNPTTASFNSAVLASQENTIISIYQASIFRGGSIVITGAATCENDNITLTLDGEEIFSDTLKNMFDTWQVNDGERSVFLRCYDLTNFIFTVAIRSGLDINSTMVLTYEESYGRNPNINCLVLYSPIPV